MAFIVLSKEDWESDGFVSDFPVGVGYWFGGIDWGSLNDWESMNDWGEGGGVLVGDACSWEEGIYFV